MDLSGFPLFCRSAVAALILKTTKLTIYSYAFLKPNCSEEMKLSHIIAISLSITLITTLVILAHEDENSYQFNQQINQYAFQSDLQKLWKDDVRKIHILTMRNKAITFIYRVGDVSTYELERAFDESFILLKQSVRAKATLIIKNSGHESENREVPHFYLEGDLTAKDYFTEQYNPLHVANIFGRAIHKAVKERYDPKPNEWTPSN